MTPCPITADRDAWRGAVTQADRAFLESLGPFATLLVNGRHFVADGALPLVAAFRQQAEASFKAREDALEQFICATINAQPDLPAQWFNEARALLARAHTATDAGGG